MKVRTGSGSIAALSEAQQRTPTVQMHAKDTQMVIDDAVYHSQQLNCHGWSCGHNLMHAC
jgi:hypothetical protein